MTLQLPLYLMVICMLAYVVLQNFCVDGPLWEAFAWSAGEAPLSLVPIWFMEKTRTEFLSTYAEEPYDDGGSDLSSNLLGHDNV